MSRHTHVEDTHQHDRGQVRRQQVVHERTHWQQAKNAVSAHALELNLDGNHGLDQETVDELCQHMDCGDGPVIFLDPEQVRRLPAELRGKLEAYHRSRFELRVPLDNEPLPKTPARHTIKQQVLAEASAEAGI